MRQLSGGAEVYQLHQLCEILPGPSGSLLENLSAQADGVPVITPPDITAHHTVGLHRIRSVGHDAAKSMERHRLRVGDLVFVRQGTIGLRTIIRPEQRGWLFGTACLRIRPTDERVLPEYLLHYLGHAPVSRWLHAQANPGQAVQTLTTRNVEELPVLLPDPSSQRALAGALDEIDEQKRINGQLIRRLGLLGRAVLSAHLGDKPLERLSGEAGYGRGRNPWS